MSSFHVLNCCDTHSALYLRRAVDDIFQQLDDNQVTLSTMKASRYVKAFEKEVDHWERKLSHILEVIEMTLQVQRQWMYLEVGHNSCCPTHCNGHAHLMTTPLISCLCPLEHFHWRRH